MTNKELRAAGQLMVDFADGKVKRVQKRVGASSWLACTHPSWDWMCAEYREAPEPKYRTYTLEEVVGLFGMHLNIRCSCETSEVVGAELYHDSGKTSVVILRRLDCAHKYCVTLDVLLQNYTRLDGSPCGVEVLND